jgi:hypothetical protein
LFIVFNISFTFSIIQQILLRSLYSDIDNVIPSKSELTFKVSKWQGNWGYKDRIVIVRKNEVLKKGKAQSSEKNFFEHQKTTTETHKFLHQLEKHYNVSCLLVYVNVTDDFKTEGTVCGMTCLKKDHRSETAVLEIAANCGFSKTTRYKFYPKSHGCALWVPENSDKWKFGEESRIYCVWFIFMVIQFLLCKYFWIKNNIIHKIYISCVPYLIEI